MPRAAREAPASSKLQRLAIVEPSRCQPRRCGLECKKRCPVVRMGRLCIEVRPGAGRAVVSEELCIGCGICVKACPFGALQIVNLPANLEADVAHRYGANTFKLHRLPTPRPGQVLGLVGANGIGKSTALKILCGKLRPNFGRVGGDAPDWPAILARYRGSELQAYFQRLLGEDMRAVLKPQYVDLIADSVCGRVGEILRAKDERGALEGAGGLLERLQLSPALLQRQVSELSGGELQRFAIALCAAQAADVFCFDEATAYLDIKQRLAAAALIRGLVGDGDADAQQYVLVVEHDLACLDYLSDFVNGLYGVGGAYGVCTAPLTVRDGVNQYIGGYFPSENLRFRDSALSFRIPVPDEHEGATAEPGARTEYPALRKSLGEFRLDVSAGDYAAGEIIVLLGENGTGKTTFIKLLAGVLKPDGGDGGAGVVPARVAYKPQQISPRFAGTVEELLQQSIADSLGNASFVAEVLRPLSVDKLLDQAVMQLSGGELQRVAIALCLGTPADVYLLDEPSAYQDVEQRLVMARLLKEFVAKTHKTAFVVEHDVSL